MKIIKTLFILVICSFVGSCVTSQWKASIVPSGTTNDAVNNAIIDFTHTSKLFKKDSVFSIVITDLNEDVLVVGIAKAVNKVFPREDNQIGSYDDFFPTRYVVKDNKLFYWNDSTYSISKEIISVLEEYKYIDYDWSKEYSIPPLIIDDGIEGAVYYICKNNYKNYKKTGANNIKRHYNVPILDCKK